MKGLHFWAIVGLSLALGFLGTGISVAAEDVVEPLTKEALSALKLIKSKDQYQRQVGFLRLEALREAASADVIRPYLETRDGKLRAQTVRALAAIEGKKAVPMLLERLAKDRDARVRQAALLGIEPFKEADTAILPACIKALLDRSTDVRMTAVDIVSRIDDVRSREAIRLRWKRERRGDVRRVLKMAIERIGNR